MRSDPLPPEALLEHAAWLRRLAEVLTRGDADAEDLVQETWLAALRSPPGDDRPVRAWLAEVLRNARRMRARAGARRARREAELGQLAEESTPSSEQLLARLEARRRLTAHVAELDEPLRSTLLLRYFEGLSAAEIARRQGVPAGTVRWRLKAGLDRLRALLDEESGGDRRSWMLLLGPLGGAGKASRITVWKGLLIMGKATKTGVGIAALGLLAAAGWWSRSSPPASPAAVGTTRAIEAKAAAATAPTASAQARQARDEMRAQILDSLRKRDAGAPPAPVTPPIARRGEPPTPPAAPGHYETSYIREHFREDMFPFLHQCYEAALQRQPALGGNLVLAFSIVGDPSVGGVVEEADFAEESDIQDEEMRTCVRESLMTLTFDKPPTGGGYVTVKYPIAFAPGNDGGDDDDGPDGGRR
jgi:RNA polymerase sigma-70 factor (ECF subfamily)